MGIEVSQSFTVNGQTYKSIEEMPPEVRALFQKVVTASAGLTGATRTSINFNGVEYANLDTMPPDVRRLYDAVLRATASGSIPADVKVTAAAATRRSHLRHGDDPVPGVQVTLTLKPAVMILLLILVGIVIFLYLLSR